MRVATHPRVLLSLLLVDRCELIHNVHELVVGEAPRGREVGPNQCHPISIINEDGDVHLVEMFQQHFADDFCNGGLVSGADAMLVQPLLPLLSLCLCGGDLGVGLIGPIGPPPR